MSQYNNWISLDTIIQDYIKRSAHKGVVDEETFYIAGEEALSQILTGDTYHEYVILLDLYNQSAQLPSNFKYPNQVAYRPPEDLCDYKQKSNDIKRYFISTINNNYTEDVRLNACESCKKTTCCCEEKQWFPIQTTDSYVKLVKTPQLATGYSKFMYGVQNPDSVNSKTHYLSEISHHVANSKCDRPAHERKVFRKKILPCFSRPKKCPEFQMVRPQSNYFFNLPSRIQKCNVPSYDTNLEYMIRDGIIKLNNYETYKCHQCNACKSNKGEKCHLNYPIEKHGQVLISYLGSKVDDKGFLMVPDTPYTIKAVIDYIIAYMAEIRYSDEMTPKTQRYWSVMTQRSEVSLIRARSKLRMPTPDRWKHFIDNIWLKSKPYSDYVENLNRYQHDQYQLPLMTYDNNFKGY